MTEATQFQAKPVTDIDFLRTMEIDLAGRAKELVLATEGANMDTPENRAVLVQQVKQIKGVIGALESERKERQAYIRDGLGAYKAQYDELIDPLSAAAARLQKILTAYQIEQERLARAEAVRLKKAEEDAALMEAQRLQRIADETRAAGNTATADAMQAQAEAVVQQAAAAPVFAPIPTETVKGVYGATAFGRTNWKWRVINPGAIPREWLIPDEKTIGAHVRARKDKTAIPGIEAYQERISSVR